MENLAEIGFAVVVVEWVAEKMLAEIQGVVVVVLDPVAVEKIFEGKLVVSAVFEEKLVVIAVVLKMELAVD